MVRHACLWRNRRKTAVAAASNGITVEAGSGRVMQLDGSGGESLSSLIPRSPRRAPPAPTSVFVFGIAAGHTTIAAMDSAGHPIGVYEVNVLPSSAAANLGWSRRSTMRSAGCTPFVALRRTGR